jgi:hypothetical protein
MKHLIKFRVLKKIKKVRKIIYNLVLKIYLIMEKIQHKKTNSIIQKTKKTLLNP